jgi:hypothetical protein
MTSLTEEQARRHCTLVQPVQRGQPGDAAIQEQSRCADYNLRFICRGMLGTRTSVRWSRIFQTHSRHEIRHQVLVAGDRVIAVGITPSGELFGDAVFGKASGSWPLIFRPSRTADRKTFHMENWLRYHWQLTPGEHPRCGVAARPQFRRYFLAREPACGSPLVD